MLAAGVVGLLVAASLPVGFAAGVAGLLASLFAAGVVGLLAAPSLPAGLAAGVAGLLASLLAAAVAGLLASLPVVGLAPSLLAA